MGKTLTIIVTYNGMQWLEKCINSLKESGHKTDIIIIDNGSKDKTIEYIKTYYPEIVLIESKKNLGFGRANNLGFEYGLKEKYEYFFLLNQDAWVFPNTIGNLIENFKDGSDYGIICPVQLNKNNHIEKIFSSYISEIPELQIPYIPNKTYENKVSSIDFANAALWMITKEAIQKTGGFSPLFNHYGEDVDYVNRLKYHGYKLGISNNSFGVHDRSIKIKKSVKEYNKQKKHLGPWPHKYYIILSNINLGSHVCNLIALRLFIGSLIKHSIKGSWFSVKYDFLVIKEVISKLPYIFITRQKAKKEKAFIKEN